MSDQGVNRDHPFDSRRPLDIGDSRGPGERVVVVLPLLQRASHSAGSGPEDESRSPEARLDEAVGLAAAIGLEIVETRIIRLQRPRAATLLGEGALASLAATVEEEGVSLVFVDGELTPIQQRNLERRLQCKVIDRTGMILEIFGARAQTAEGRLQVELASLTYQRSRLVRSWTHLERQRGGFGFLGGPGETQIEADRRQIDTRIARLKSDLAQVARTRSLHRAARQRRSCPVVALVGYTNAGKSTLFNRMTGEAVIARDQLFATLDPTIRGLRLPSGQEIVLSDTVGFVSNLPTGLVAAFRATLEEVVNADLILHVRDASHPDTAVQKGDVERVLSELGIGPDLEGGPDRGPPVLEVMNKIDRLADEDRAPLLSQAHRDQDSRPVPVSALCGDGLAGLLDVLDRRLAKDRRIYEFDLSPEDGASLAWLYRHGTVIARDEDSSGQMHLRVELSPESVIRYHRRARPGRESGTTAADAHESGPNGPAA